jgi:hypothetical protein
LFRDTIKPGLKKSSLRVLLFHHKTTNTRKSRRMTNGKHPSLFSQMIALINRKNFHLLVDRHQMERFTKNSIRGSNLSPFSFVRSPRSKANGEISSGLASCMGKMKHSDCITTPCTFIKWRHRANTDFVLPYLSAYPNSHGLNFVGQKGLLNSIYFCNLMDICRSMPTSPTLKNRYHCCASYFICS